MSYLEPIPTVADDPKTAPAADYNCGWSLMSYLVRLSVQADRPMDTAEVEPRCAATV